MNESKITGLITPIFTLFLRDGKIAEDHFSRFIQIQSTHITVFSPAKSQE